MKRYLIAVLSGLLLTPAFAGDRTIYAGEGTDAVIPNLFLASDNEKPAPDSTVVRIRREGKFLRILAEMTLEKDFSGPTEGGKTGGWPMTDSVEIFLDPGAGGNAYFHLAAGIDGTLYDGRLEKKPWKPDWTCRLERSGNKWTADFRIPVKAETGDRWGFNFCRNVKGSTDYFTTWARVGAMFHTPGKFEILFFGSPEEAEKAENAKFAADADPLRREIRALGMEKNFPELFSGKLSRERIVNTKDELEIIRMMERSTK